MADDDEVALARAALSAPAPDHDPEVLDAVHVGLLGVPVADGSPGRAASTATSTGASTARTDDAPGLAIRRRTGY